MNILSSRIDEPALASEGIAYAENAGDAYTAPGVAPLRQIMRMVLRWKWLVLGSVAACLLLGVIITLLMTPQYSAFATIEISREGDQVTEFEGVEREVAGTDQEFYETQYGLLRARSLAERVATQLRLVDDPSFFEMFGGAQSGPEFELRNGRYVASGRQKRLREAAKILLDHVTIAPASFSRLVNVGFTSPDASFSARVANSWAESFIEVNLERKSQSTSYGRDQLQTQLAEYKDRLDESQRQLVAYASNEEIINLPAQSGGDGAATQERSILVDDLANLNAELSRATADRIAAEARFQQAGQRGASIEALQNQAINNLRQRRAELSAQYEQLMVQFQPEYPAARAIQSQIAELDTAISQEESRVSGSLQSNYRAALQREKDLKSRVARLKSEFLDLRRRSIQYNIFQQEVDTNRALYDGLLQRFKEIGVAGGVGVNNISIVDLANVPEAPSSPNLIFNILVSIIAGLAVGGALALVFEQLDEAIDDPEELEKRLGLPLLGAVPNTVDDTPSEALANPKSELFDAYLAVQTNLAFTTDHGVPRSFAVTSTRPAEGKSTTSLALATTLARSGRKVILVDGDLRSPSVHQLGGVGHERGLSNFLTGDDDISSMTFDMPNLGFVAMSSGPIPPNAAQLLMGNRLSALVERLLEQFDHVVIDSPPVLGLADAPLIANQVHGIIYAVESHGTKFSTVATALNRLETVKARILGGVLTKFEPRKAHGYDYDYGYSYGREDADATPA